VGEFCRLSGADTELRSLDLTDVEAAIVAVSEADADAPISLALFVAGLGDIRSADEKVESAEQVRRLGLVNFVAPCAMASALAQRMTQRSRGGIVFVGSAAAFHALPFATAYTGSKAGLARFADALRIGVAQHGISVTLISPGFIDTAAGRAVTGPKPLQMAPADAATRIARAAAAGKAHVVLPWPFAWLRWLDRLLPRPVRDRLLLALTPSLG